MSVKSTNSVCFYLVILILLFITQNGLGFVAQQCADDTGWPETKKRIERLKEQHYCTGLYTILECKEALGITAAGASLAVVNQAQKMRAEMLRKFKPPRLCNIPNLTSVNLYQLILNKAYAASSPIACANSVKLELMSIRSSLSVKAREIESEIENLKKQASSAKSDPHEKAINQQLSELQKKIENENRTIIGHKKRASEAIEAAKDQDLVEKIKQSRDTKIKDHQDQIQKFEARANSLREKSAKISERLPLSEIESKIKSLTSQKAIIAEDIVKTYPSALGRTALLEGLESIGKKYNDDQLGKIIKDTYLKLFREVAKSPEEMRTVQLIAKSAVTRALSTPGELGRVLGSGAAGLGFSFMTYAAETGCAKNTIGEASWVGRDPTQCEKLNPNAQDPKFINFLFLSEGDQREQLKNSTNCIAFNHMYADTIPPDSPAACVNGKNELVAKDDKQKTSFKVTYDERTGKILKAVMSGRSDNYQLDFDDQEAVKKIDYSEQDRESGRAARTRLDSKIIRNDYERMMAKIQRSIIECRSSTGLINTPTSPNSISQQ